MKAIISSELQYTYGGNARTNYLTQGQQLNPGDQLISPNGLFRLIYQTNGDLCLYDWTNHMYWHTGTTQHPVGTVYQNDGNFVIYTNNGVPVWAANVYNYGPGQLTLQDDGNLVIYQTNNNNPVVKWQTGTHPSIPPMTRNALFANDVLRPGDMLVSNNKLFYMVFDTRGTLVIYKSPGLATWSSNTALPAGKTIGITMMHETGKLYVYYGDMTEAWSSNYSPIKSNSYAILQDDGNLVIYNNQTNPVAQWASNTVTNPLPTQPIAITTTTSPACGSVASVNGGNSATSVCGGVVSLVSGCGAVLSGLGMCGAVYSGASFCAIVANGVSVCGLDTAGFGVCGVVAALAGAATVSVTGVGGCAAVAAVASACGAVVSGAGVSAIGAGGASACGAVACGAAACGADASGAGACAEAKGTGACGANAVVVTGAGVCGAQVGFCGAVLCVALPIGGNW